MAKQKGPLMKIVGRIDDMSYYRTQDGFLAREKRGIDPARLRSDPAFINTRKAMDEFTSAAQSAKLFRSAWKNELAVASDGRVVSRCTRAFSNVIKSDTVNRKGLRNAVDGDLTLLNRFEFNIAAPLDACMAVDHTIAFNRATGTAAISLPTFEPRKLIAMPDMATHYQLFAAAATIDFATGTVFTARVESAALPWDEDEQDTVDLALALPAASTAPVFFTLGITYAGITNGFSDPVSKNANAYRVILVDAP